MQVHIKDQFAKYLSGIAKFGVYLCTVGPYLWVIM